MAIFKDMLVRGIYHAEHGLTDTDQWTRVMVDECGARILPHLHCIMYFSFRMACKNCSHNRSLKKELKREIKKLRRLEKG